MSQQVDYRVPGEFDAQAAYVSELGDTPVNPYTLLNAVNETSELCHTGWLIFLGVVAYFCIAVAGVTHKDLLLNSAVELPVMQVSIDLTRFFLFAPMLLVFLHFGLLVQHVMLARKVLEFDAAVRPLEASARRNHPLRLELHSYYFTQQLAGPDRSPLLGGFLHGMFWLSVFGLPIVVILYIQLVFLPYHDVNTTWAHRIALLADAGLLMLIGVFLGSRSASFLRAFGRTARFQPISFLVTGVLIATVVFFSLFVATIPGERMDRIAAGFPGARIEVTADATNTPARSVFAVTAWFFDGGASVGRNAQSFFRRNLIVTDETVVASEAGNDRRPRERTERAGQATNTTPNVSLRGRDLRFAVLDRSVLENVDFTGADLEGASLVRAKLSGSRLSCADIDAVLKKLVTRADACARLHGVLFSGAELNNADLRGALLNGAKFENAELNGADLRYTELIDVDFSGAQLRRALLSGGTPMLGANFLGAQLQGADLTGAKMHGADFSGAGLQGAQLNFAQAYGVNFQSAELDGALINAAKLQGANFTDATMTGVDLGTSSLWLTLPSAPDKLGFADLSQVRIRSLDTTELNAVIGTLEGIDSARLRSRLERALDKLMDKRAQSNLGWDQSADGQTWANYKSRSGGLDQSVFLTQLSEYLARTACEARFSDGAVAAGLIRRALAPSFKGNTSVILDRMQTNACPGARNISDEQMMRLAASSELAKQKATATSGDASTVFLGGP